MNTSSHPDELSYDETLTKQVIKSFLKGIPFHHHKTAEAVWCSW